MAEQIKEEKKTKEQLKEEKDKLVTDIIAAQAELDALKKEHGLDEEEKGVKKVISNFFDKRGSREKVAVSKKKYIWLAVLLGWVGAHRFYSKHYILGFVYLALFWSGVSIAMTIIDLMVIIPMQADENGNVFI